MRRSLTTSLDYISPAVPRITWERLRAQFFVAGCIAAIGAMACSAMTLWAGRLPPPIAPLSILGILIGIASAGLWVASVAVEIVVVKWVGRPARRQATLLLVLIPVLLAGTSAVLASGVPSRLMFLANKPAMDRWSKAFLATPGPPPSQARIGSYEAYHIEPIPGGVRFFVEGSGFFRSGGGFAYSPAGPPLAGGPAYETYTPIGGAWYAWTYEEP